MEEIPYSTLTTRFHQPTKVSYVDRSHEGCDRIQRVESESDLVSFILLYFDEPMVVQEALCKMIRKRSTSPKYTIPSYESVSEASKEAAQRACLVLPANTVVKGLALLLGHPAGASTKLKADLVYTVITALDRYQHDPWIQINGFRWLTHLYHLTHNRFLMADAIPLAVQCLQEHYLLQNVLEASIDYLNAILQYGHTDSRHVEMIARCQPILQHVVQVFPNTILANHCQELMQMGDY